MVDLGNSGITNDTFPTQKYYDFYNAKSYKDFGNRILGDATGEMGPFATYLSSNLASGSWYDDESVFPYPSKESNFFARGGTVDRGMGNGIFCFLTLDRVADIFSGFRIVLAFK